MQSHVPQWELGQVTPPGCSHVLDPDSVHPNLSPADLRLQTWASRRVLLPLRLDVEPPSCDSVDAWPPSPVCWENSPRAQSCSDTCTRRRWPTPLPGVRLPRSSSCTESLSGVCHAFLQIQVRALPAGLGIRPAAACPHCVSCWAQSPLWTPPGGLSAEPCRGETLPQARWRPQGFLQHRPLVPGPWWQCSGLGWGTVLGTKSHPAPRPGH